MIGDADVYCHRCGSYMIHPNQMNVDYPTNVCDDSITPLGPGSYAVSCKMPTEMTYFLFRLRFATVFREMVDAAWETGSEMDDLPYEMVLQFDKKLNDLAAEFEIAYSTVMKNAPDPSGTNTLRKDGSWADSKSTQLIRQRNMAMFGMHTRFARLHRPYLVRGAQDPRYSYSRMVCLRSARTVIELGRMMTITFEDISFIKIWAVNHHVFVSTVILVMDYCFNREEPRAKERKEEILECFRLLEGTAEESTIASRGLMKLKKMLSEKSGSPPRPGSSQASSQPPPTSYTASTTNSIIDPNAGSNTNAHKPPLAREQSQYMATEPLFASYQNPPVVYMTGLNNNNTSQSTPNLPTVEMQNPWPNCEYFPYDNINFDVDLDASQFEALFQGIDAAAYS